MFDEWIDNNRIRTRCSSRDSLYHCSAVISHSFHSSSLLPSSLFFSLLRGFFHQPGWTVFIFHARSSKLLFSLSAFPSSPLVRVSTFKICSRPPRRDVDARYSGYRVTSSSQCSEINSSGKMLLVVRPLSLVHLF